MLQAEAIISANALYVEQATYGTLLLKIFLIMEGIAKGIDVFEGLSG